VLLDYFIKNPEKTFLHGETLNVLFQSNPSTKEQNFLSQMLFRYIDEREGELIRPWLRIHQVGIPVGTVNFDDKFNQYPLEIKHRKCGYSRVKLDLSNGSYQSLHFFDYLSRCSNDTIMSDLKYLIDYKWHILRWWYRGYSFIMWFMTFTTCLNLVWLNESVFLIVLNILLNLLFLYFEVKCFAKNPKKYLESKLNGIDAFIFTFDIIIVILGGVSNNDAVEYAITLCLVILCVRAMTHLRIFDGTRYLIIMILKVFNEIASFLVIYVFFVLAYAIIWLKLSLLGGSEIDYTASLYFSTNLAFGEYDSSEFTRN